MRGHKLIYCSTGAPQYLRHTSLHVEYMDVIACTTVVVCCPSQKLCSLFCCTARNTVARSIPLSRQVLYTSSASELGRGLPSCTLGQSTGRTAEAGASQKPARRNVCQVVTLNAKHAQSSSFQHVNHHINQVSSSHLLTNQQICRAVSSGVLVPGDVVVLLPGTATCDMVLLQGNCLVEESSLSGEVGSSTGALFLHRVTSPTQQSTCRYFSSTWQGLDSAIKLSHMPISVINVLQLLCIACCFSVAGSSVQSDT